MIESRRMTLTPYDILLVIIYLAFLMVGMGFLSLPWTPVLIIISSSILLFLYYILSKKLRGEESDRGRLYRKLLHIIGGLFLTLSTIYYSPASTAYLVLTLLITFLFYEVIRWHILKKPIWLSEALAFFGDPEESREGAFREAIFGLIGVSVILIFLDEKAALCGLITLSVGDGFSGLIGEKLRILPLPFNKKKTVGGLIAGSLASFAAVTIILQDPRGIFGVLFGMLMEAISGDFDNLSVPISSALLYDFLLNT